MLKDLIWCLVIYLLYRLVFELVIPVARTVIKMRQTVSKMQGQQPFQQQQPQQQTASKPQPQKASTTASINEEYIDFEEIKD
ncbi:hypothetical protein [Parasediminibacterium sp. JCM 36343]|uniref:hypothetical protein n=1 Tax=Parasediminibacterium sp. JCM 36343 TaxID=3374279 RepID=UPI0039788FD4